MAPFGNNLRGTGDGSGEFFPKDQVLQSSELQNFYPPFPTPEKLQLKVSLYCLKVNQLALNQPFPVRFSKTWLQWKAEIALFMKKNPWIGSEVIGRFADHNTELVRRIGILSKPLANQPITRGKSHSENSCDDKSSSS